LLTKRLHLHVSSIHCKKKVNKERLLELVKSLAVFKENVITKIVA
jgi:hypothetical protein